MTIALAQTVRATGTNGASTVSKSITVSSGSALNVVVGGGSGQSVSGVSDGTNTYTSRGSVTFSVDSYKLSQFTASNVSAGTYTVTATFSAGTDYPWIFIQEITGTNGYDASARAYQGATSPTSTDGITTGTVTPSAQPGLVVGLIYGPGASSPGTGFSFDTYGNDGGRPGYGYAVSWATEYKRITSTSAVAATWTNGSSSDSIATVMALFTEGTSSSPSGARHFYDMMRVR